MKFNVTGKLTITVTTEVEAPDEESARSIASERTTSGSWRDTGKSSEEWVHDELDGEPEILTVVPCKER